MDQLVNNEHAVKIKDTAILIRSTTHGAEKTITDIRFALAKSNTQILKDYLTQITELDQKLKELLKKVDTNSSEEKAKQYLNEPSA